MVSNAGAGTGYGRLPWPLAFCCILPDIGRAMASIKRAILHGLRNVIRFRGRDARAQFWPYAIFTYIMVAAISLTIAVPIMVRAILEAAARAGPGNGSIDYGPGHISLRVSGGDLPDMSDFFLVVVVSGVVTVLLLAAAVVRRLHDTGRSGAWGLLPLPFTVTAAIMFPKVMGGEEPPMDLFFLLFANNIVYLLALGFLIYLLLRRTIEGPNRYGDMPGDLDRSTR
jgi:uncharacterized membrane protein YhaH (DUF805 family)